MEKEAIFSCPECGKDFKSLTALKVHRSLHDDKKKVNSTDKDKNSKQKLAWGSKLVTGTLSILVIFALAQTVQSAVVLSKINKFEGSGSSSAVPASVENLPNMVGGC